MAAMGDAGSVVAAMGRPDGEFSGHPQRGKPHPI